MVGLCFEGDTDADGSADMRVFMRILKLLTGTDTGDICSEADTGDGKTGTEEAVMILKEISK